MKNKKTGFSRSLSALLCSLFCSSSSFQAMQPRIPREIPKRNLSKGLPHGIPNDHPQRSSSAPKPLLNRSDVPFRRAMNITTDANGRPSAFGPKVPVFKGYEKSFTDKAVDFVEEHPYTTLGGGLAGTMVLFRWVLYPFGSGVPNLYYWLTNPSIRTLASYIGRPVKLILKVAEKKIKFKDLDALGKDLKEHKGWVHDIKNLKTLLKLWSIKVDFKEDNTIVAAGKTVGHYVIYPFEQGTGVSRDNTNVMKRWKGSDNDPNYPILMHGGCLDKPYSIENAMWQWAADTANRTGKYIDRLISTEAVAMLTLHCFLVNNGWANSELCKRVNVAPAADVGAPANSYKGTYVTYIRNDKTPKVPYAFGDAFGHGSSEIKPFGDKKMVNGTDKDSSEVVWANEKSFFIRIPDVLSKLPSGGHADVNGTLVAPDPHNYVKTQLENYADKEGGKVVSRENAGLQFLDYLRGKAGDNVFVVTYG